ncbi:hypothetical protein [Paenibacillus harenae]|uniref:WD40 repeat domain-containing protein n=1 Tax=Paenibacillus harenae TaxID=306543 RepID=A0ABT9U9A2_PAEHA|nr:hypothetical protein [Paenibacillus harenae]MDQ0116233.1 hypothetical protein [Paenibacillus harenae]
MKQGKYIVIFIVTCMLTIAGCSSNEALEERDASPEVSAEPQETKGWVFVGDEHYDKLLVNTENPILLNRIQARHRVKNKLIEGALHVVALHGNNTLENIVTTKFEAKLDTGIAEFALKLQRLKIDGRSITIPQDRNDFPLGFTLTKDGKQSYFVAENGIWGLNDESNEFKRLTPSTYNGKTYEDLAKTAMKWTGEPIVAWNGDERLSPDGTQMVYFGDKHDVGSGDSALFALDIASGVETMIAHAEGYSYLLAGWLDSQRVISSKYNNSGSTYVMVHLNGKESKLDLRGDSPMIYDVQNEIIAYYTPFKSGGSEFRIASISKKGTVSEMVSFPMDGSSRQDGYASFSPNNTYFAAIFVPDDEPKARYLKVLDIRGHTVVDIASLPDTVSRSADIIGYDWVDENTLLITISEERPDGESISTWTFSIG